MELLGSYWLRRALARLASLTVYEGQDTRTGMPVMVLVGAKGEPVEAEGSLKVLDRLEDALVLDTISTIETMTTGMSGKIWQKISLLPN